MFDRVFTDSNRGKLVVFGTGYVAITLYEMLTEIGLSDYVRAFMVSGVPEKHEMYGLPVISLSSTDDYHPEDLVIVAVAEKYKTEIFGALNDQGIKNAISASFESGLNEEIRAEYVRKTLDKCDFSFASDILKRHKTNNGTGNKPVVYRVQSHLDSSKVLVDKIYDYETVIQAGAALTPDRISDVCDDTGDNISCKNPQFCELTALYWIWKNTNDPIVGMCHYRRHFRLNEEEISILFGEGYDVILTVPIIHYPDVFTQYSHVHSADDWSVLVSVVKCLYPEYSDTLSEIGKGQFYCGYNMMITRRDIFDKYCEWVFPILEYCERECKPRTDKYQNRFVGFLAERLLTTYFWYNRDKYRIVFSAKEYLE